MTIRKPSHRLSVHFTLGELRCKDGTPVPDRFYDNAVAICERAEALRFIAGPLLVKSGYRTESHNRKVGGAKRSTHLTASALDLRSAKYSGPQLAQMYLRLIDEGLVPDGGVGRYDTFVHIDLGRPRRWGF